MKTLTESEQIISWIFDLIKLTNYIIYLSSLSYCNCVQKQKSIQYVFTQ